VISLLSQSRGFFSYRHGFFPKFIGVEGLENFTEAEQANRRESFLTGLCAAFRFFAVWVAV